MNVFKRILRIISYVLFAFCLVGLIFCAASSDKLDITNYEFKTDKSDPFSCLVISDYHHRSLIFANGNMIDILIDNPVDYVFFTGDLIDTHTTSLDDVEKIFDVSKKISKACYFVTGNHEEYAPYWNDLLTLMEEKNIIYLKDKDIKINNLHLFGLDDIRFKVGGNASFKTREEMNKKTIDENFMDKIDINDLNILLMHRPENFKMIANNYKFDMVITGHTHGGQFKLNNWVPSSIFQEESDYMGGKYNKNDSTLFVSRGLGYSAMFPIRVNCNPEIIKITISK